MNRNEDKSGLDICVPMDHLGFLVICTFLYIVHLQNMSNRPDLTFWAIVVHDITDTTRIVSLQIHPASIHLLERSLLLFTLPSFLAGNTDVRPPLKILKR